MKPQEKAWRGPKHQAGIGAAGWLFVILVFGSLMSLASTIVPMYLDYNTMSKVLDGMAEEKGLAKKRDATLQKMIVSRFKLNNIRDYKVHEIIDIKRSRDGVELVMDYEVRKNLFRNLDIIASFDKTVELRN